MEQEIEFASGSAEVAPPASENGLKVAEWSPRSSSKGSLSDQGHAQRVVYLRSGERKSISS